MTSVTSAMERAFDSIETLGRESSSLVQMCSSWKSMLRLGQAGTRGQVCCDDTDAASPISTCAAGYGRGVSNCSTEDDMTFTRYNSEEEDSSDSGEWCSDTLLSEGLTVGEALALQGSLLKVFEQPTFQEDLACILRELGPDAAECLDEDRSALCVKAAYCELLAYGFEASREGLARALRALEGLAGECEEVCDCQEALYDSIGLAPPFCRDAAFGC
mmetsp:Transcript_103177/g.274311  ORF Transcript_103177/g.274311 Transcript_103177/m.274311 type:complete len:217 (-) Transcript_103177:37-687(-)